MVFNSWKNHTLPSAGIYWKHWPSPLGTLKIKEKFHPDNFLYTGIWVNKGEWDSPMDCGSKGFRLIRGREQPIGLKGIVNVQGFCSDSYTEITSNNDMSGDYNPELECFPNQQVVGVQVKEEIYHGLINFKVLCAWKMIFLK